MMNVRQGDVLLVRVDSLSDDAMPAAPHGGHYVLAYGEVTGHDHSVASEDAELLYSRIGRFLRVHRETELTHPEHTAISLPPGIYRVVRQREYMPTEPESTRWVSD